MITTNSFRHINTLPIRQMLHLLIMGAAFMIGANAQTVSGTVTCAGSPVSGALVVLIDRSDTTVRFSQLTGTTGKFSLAIVASAAESSNIPEQFTLAQNYPNPFTHSTAIPYELHERSDVRIAVYDILGRTVRKFEIGEQPGGSYGIRWDGRNEQGIRSAAGTYFYTMNVGGKMLTRKMLFGNGGNGNGAVPLSFASGPASTLSAMDKRSGSGTYRLRVENGNKTSPLITAMEIESLTVLRDTMIDVTVQKKMLASSATILADSLRQIVRGFGASNVLLWRPDMTESEVTTAFGTDDGQVGFTILRIMAESDSSRWPLYLPSTQKAQSMGAMIIASPWFAPSSMVETAIVPGDTVSRVRYDQYANYITHLNAFTAYMKRNGVEIYGLSVQNEPDITDTWTSWTPAEMLTLMKNYAQALVGTNVMAPESFQYRRQMSDPVLNDSAACANTDIVCGHIYGGGLSAYPLAQQKGKEVWMTEILSGEKSQANDWTTCIPVAQQMNDVLQAGMSTYVWWNIVRFYGPISDGTSNSGAKGSVTKKGYVMSQFSRFIRPGYRILRSSSTLSGVSITAAKGDPSKLVIVATNANAEPVQQTFTVKNSTVAHFITYTTSAAKNCLLGNSVTVVNGTCTVTLEPSSVTTFVSY